MFVSQYRPIYEVAQDRVYILAFVHTSRDLERLWEREDRSAHEENT